MKRKIKMIIKIFICSIIIILGIGIYYKAMENTFGVTFYDINSDKIYENIRIINLSDLHLKEFGKNNERLVKKIKELSVILCGQDGIISEKSGMVQQSILTINLKIQPRE